MCPVPSPKTLLQVQTPEPFTIPKSSTLNPCPQILNPKPYYAILNPTTSTPTSQSSDDDDAILYLETQGPCTQALPRDLQITKPQAGLQISKPQTGLQISEEALMLDPHSPKVHSTLGCVHRHVRGESIHC